MIIWRLVNRYNLNFEFWIVDYLRCDPEVLTIEVRILSPEFLACA